MVRFQNKNLSQNSVSNQIPKFLPDFGPADGLIVQLKLFCRIWSLAQLNTSALCCSVIEVYTSCSMFILEEMDVLVSGKTMYMKNMARRSIEPYSHIYHVVGAHSGGEHRSGWRYVLQHRFGSPQQSVIVIGVKVIFTLCCQSGPGQRGHKSIHVAAGWVLWEQTNKKVRLQQSRNYSNIYDSVWFYCADWGVLHHPYNSWKVTAIPHLV